MAQIIISLMIFTLTTVSLKETADSGSSRTSKFLNVISWIRFDNVACDSSMGDKSVGTCYTATECSKNLKGIAAGGCASGYGVCCVQRVSCGSRTSANNTYFVNPNYPSTYPGGSNSNNNNFNRNGNNQCRLSVLKDKTAEICQIRLDFLEFDLQQPDDVTHLCDKDKFRVSSGWTNSPPLPTLCGSNRGAHMYVDASSDCSGKDVFANGSSKNNSRLCCTMDVVTEGTFSRLFKIFVRQIPCGATFGAGEGCLQYFDSLSGRMESFNYNGALGRQLSSQHYSICVRNQRGFCGISYSACPDANKNHAFSEAFTLSGSFAPSSLTAVPLVMTGESSCATDWINIPCGVTVVTNITNATTTTTTASPSAMTAGQKCVDRLCGETFCPAADSQCKIVSRSLPFQVRVHFDDDEVGDGPPFLNKGFCLDFEQIPCS